MTIKFAIITCSDTRTLETDEAGQKLEQLIAEQGWECVRRVVEMDERPFIAGALIAQPRLSGLIDALGGAFGMVLGMTGAGALILLVSVASALAAVGGGIG